MHVVSSLRRFGVKNIFEATYDVTGFRRSLQPERTKRDKKGRKLEPKKQGGRKKLMFQFYGHDATMRLGKADYQMGGRLHTVYADDIADIR